MELKDAVILTLSGALIATSILMSSFGYARQALSRFAAAAITGVGVGVGIGTFIFFGVGKGDLLGSLTTAVLVGAAAALSWAVRLGWHR